MELPQAFTHLMHAKEEKKELFLSLLLDVTGVVANLWHVDEKKLPVVASWASQDVSEDSWDARLMAADSAISSLDVSDDTIVNKVILGLPAVYLTEEGDIKKDIRPHLRKITHSLELTPMGFVSTHQALVHQLKREEGVPPTVILLGISDNTMMVSVYKIGTLVGQKIVEEIRDVVSQLEESFHGFQELEVLPSRILMYGTKQTQLEDMKRELLRYPWQTKANFMHFPKIDVVSEHHLIHAVSVVGASELAVTLGLETEEAPVVPEQTSKKEEEKPTPEEAEQESNVVLVDPSRLGFKRSVDVLNEERVSKRQSKMPQAPEKEPAPRTHAKLPLSFPPHISLPPFSTDKIKSVLSRLAGVRRAPAIIIALLVMAGLAWVFYWFIPRVSVTVYEVPKKLTKSAAIIIDPTATVADSSSKTLPGKKQEKTVSGEKAIPVSGKKQIGDPAKGAVTIYNKSTSGQTFAKGAVLTAGAIKFTLDTTVSVASASESLSGGTLTYGKATAGITASTIGTQGNLPSSTEFHFQSVDADVAVARNDQALAGGSSKDITVVSRADQDALVKALTQELVDKAKQDLASAVVGNEQLIDATVKTSVVDKSFIEELDQETTTLHGKLTISITGTSYSKSDLITLMTGIISPDIPPGYIFDEKNVVVTTGDVLVKKDGKITTTANFEGTATPQFNLTSIRQSLAGKSMSQAQEYLKSIPGVGGVAFRMQLSPFKNQLPANAKNISISVAVQE